MSRSAIEPLHIATVAGQPLRFYKTPLDDGWPDLPWHAVDDLHRCLGLNRAARKHFLSMLGAEWKEPQTVATADGIITVAPHFMAQGWIDTVVETGQAPSSVRREFDPAGTEALKHLTAHIPLGTGAWFTWIRAAMNRWEHAHPLSKQP